MNNQDNLMYIKNVIEKYNDVFLDNSMRENVLKLMSENYSERAYHNLTHIVDCLKKLDSYLSKNDNLKRMDQIALVCAILFHDIIYGANNEISDEQLSAKVFEDFISEYCKNEHLISTTKELILSTEHLQADFKKIYASQMLIDIMADIDLSILGSSYLDYTDYLKKVRDEYSEVNEEDFAKGRVKVLFHLIDKLNKDKLFKTDYFKSLNVNAKDNLENEMLFWNNIIKKYEQKNII